ncbi:MAG TPA: hypothetical protein VFW16_16070 [Streptosporangiaceae bacterium]|nr:hypothetical protein [Streptosporangiaceae bacterium]
MISPAVAIDDMPRQVPGEPRQVPDEPREVWDEMRQVPDVASPGRRDGAACLPVTGDRA